MRIHRTLAILATLVIGTAVLEGCCDSSFGCDDPPLGPDLRVSFFDTIAIADTLHPGDSLTAVVAYPSGCNSFSHIDQSFRHDTLMILPIYEFEQSKGIPCAHGPGLDTMRIRMFPWLDSSTHWVSYPKGNAYQEQRTGIVTVPVSVR